MIPLVSFRQFEPFDCVAISRTLSAQLLTMGLTEDPASIGEGEALAAAGPAWTACDRDGAILCCAGFAETFPGVQANAWAMLAPAIGPAHLAITRFAEWQIATSPLARIDALVSRRPREMKWARLVGLELVATLGPWGPLQEPTLLYSRIRRPGAPR